MSFNIDKTRSDFPILEKKVYDKKLIYLDSAASAQKPISVINSMKSFQEEEYANVHRGIHYLSNLATDQYELSRKKVKGFINANNEDEIIFRLNSCKQYFAREVVKLISLKFSPKLIFRNDKTSPDITGK